MPGVRAVNAVPASEEALDRAARIIREGGLVAFPTETVYGLGADAFNGRAVSRIFQVKRRPAFDPLIVHVHDISSLEMVAGRPGEREKALAERFWPGPLTIVLGKSKVPPIVTAGLETVAVRMPDNPVALELIRKSGTPVAAPSANPFGQLSPTRAGHVLRQLGDRIDLVLDGGPCRVGVESTIVRCDEDGALLLRPGGVPAEEIEEITGPLRQVRGGTPDSPGQLPAHYAPHVPLRIVDDFEGISGDPRTAILLFQRPDRPLPFGIVEVLSENGDLLEAASNLFSALHRLDESDIDRILAVSIPETGLGRAIMDRLRRAETGSSTRR